METGGRKLVLKALAIGLMLIVCTSSDCLTWEYIGLVAAMLIVGLL